MPLKITLGTGADKELPTQATITLQAKKTLAGNILVNDHDKMSIVIVPSKMKIMTIPKPYAGEGIYDYQRDLMDSLFQGGVIEYDTIQGGNNFGVIEGTISNNDKVDPIQVALLEVEKFIQKASTAEMLATDYDQHIEDRFTDPTAEDSTAYGEIPPYQDTPEGAQDSLPYVYVGAGYYY
jgi:hypothetical protein